MPASVGGSVASSVSAAERVTANKLDAIRVKMPNSRDKAEKVEAKYDVVLDCESRFYRRKGRMGRTTNVGLVPSAWRHRLVSSQHSALISAVDCCYLLLPLPGSHARCREVLPMLLAI